MYLAADPPFGPRRRAPASRRGCERVEASRRPSQSGFELDVLDAIRQAGLPEPARQYELTLPSGEVIHVDLAWPDVRLGVEPGHSWWHGGDLGQRRDQARDRACDAIGWRIVRYDEEDRKDLAGHRPGAAGDPPSPAALAPPGALSPADVLLRNLVPGTDVTPRQNRGVRRGGRTGGRRRRRGRGR